jgi:hypothetical protein
MHAYLSTQISRRLRYYGLTCCGDVHESELMCGRSWCKQCYTKQGLTPVVAGRIQRRGRTWWSWIRTRRSRPHHHHAYRRNHTCPGNGWQGWIIDEKKGLRALPFSDN